jgi:histidine triad (HIT) family protein
MKNNCVFCAIAAGEIPSFKVYEDEEFLAYLDINPFSEGHILVIPKEHYENLLDVDEEVLKKLIVRVKKIARRATTALDADGFNILQNNGEAAGQTVKHIHFHIVPRKNGEQLVFENTSGDMEKLKALAERLKF